MMKEKKTRIRKDAYDYQWSVSATDALVLALLLWVSTLRRTRRNREAIACECAKGNVAGCPFVLR